MWNRLRAQIGSELWALLRALLRLHPRGRALVAVLDEAVSLEEEWSNAHKPSSEGGVELSPAEQSDLLGRAMDLLRSARELVAGSA